MQQTTTKIPKINPDQMVLAGEHRATLNGSWLVHADKFRVFSSVGIDVVLEVACFFLLCEQFSLASVKSILKS